MFTPVKRWKRILIQVLVAAQLIAAAPLASALTGVSHANAAPCDGLMDMSNMPSDSGHCPCCPDGADSVAACLAACSAAFGITAAISVSQMRVESSRVDPPIVTAHSRVFDPPLKPPPIA
jgi:hypothetical protein